MDAKLKMGPTEDEEFQKRDLERTESSKNETKKCRTLSRSLKENCNAKTS